MQLARFSKQILKEDIPAKQYITEFSDWEKTNSGRGTYRLTDNFFRFWYAFGFANYSQLEDGDVNGVYEYIVKPALHEFASFVFEDVCREFVREMQKDSALPFRYMKMGRWTGKTTVRDENAKNGLRTAETEIDLLGIGRGAKEYNVKFYYLLFSENGFDDKIIEEAEKADLRLYSLETIVNYK